MDVVISQHCIVLAFVKEFVKQHGHVQPVPRIIIPDNYYNDCVHDVGDIDMTSMTAAPMIQI
jgi:hypothetical protein